MRKKSTRFLSAALAACMVASTLPVSAFAAQPAAASAESSVSVQEEATQLNAGDEISNTGNYTMSGDYATGITINTTGNVTITITGPVGIAKGSLLRVVQVGSLTIENNGNYKVETTDPNPGSGWISMFQIDETNEGTVTVNGGIYESLKYEWEIPFAIEGGTAFLNNVTATTSANAVDVSKANVTINGGEYTEVTHPKHPTLLLESGTLTVNKAKVVNQGKNLAIYVKDGTCTLNSGNYRSNGNVIAISNQDATCNIYGGTYTVEGSYTGIHNVGTLLIDGEDVKIISEVTSTGTVVRNVSEGNLTINRGSIEVKGDAARRAISCGGNSTTTINGGIIEGAEYGIYLEKDTPSVTLNDVDFIDNANDIYLGTDLTITIDENYTGIATVGCADAKDGRQITTSADGQDKLNLISNDVDANGKTYVVAYNETGNYRYLAERTGYTVTAVNATAMTADGTLSKLDQIEEDTKVTLTADAPEGGKQFSGWKFEKVTTSGLQEVSISVKEDPENPGTGTFKMPDSDLIVTAQYEDEIIDPGTSDGDYGGDIAAGVVIGGIAVVGTGLYRITQMDDVAMPANRLALAKLLWERAGKPEPENTALYSDISAEDEDAQKAARWAVEQELLKEDDSVEGELKFHPAFPVSKLRVCLTWEKAKQKGLFDQNTEA